MKKTFDFLTLLFSLIFGSVWCFLGGLMYNCLHDLLWTPLLIGLYFLGLALSLLLGITVSNALGSNATPRKDTFQKGLFVMAIVFVCSILFEFLYELQFTSFQIGEPTSYIFVIDDSGSMNGFGGNDPNGVRYDAIEEITASCDADFPVAVYRFATSCYQSLDITPATDYSNALLRTDDCGGGTDIDGAVRTVLTDIKSGQLRGGSSPRILLLSDGSNDFNISALARDCLEQGVSVSTVGFGGASSHTLKTLAENTYGTFVWANDLGSLSQAMSTAATTFTAATRDLLSYRPGSDLLYGILRCVFLLAIAAGFVLMKIFMFSTFDQNNVVLTILFVAAGLGALCPELLTNVLDLDPGIARLLVCLTFSLLMGASKSNNNQNMYNNPTMGQGFGGPMGGSMGNSYAGFGDKRYF